MIAAAAGLVALAAQNAQRRLPARLEPLANDA
jgi:hypothetical protein